jgi:aryl carrier-like protein
MVVGLSVMLAGIGIAIAANGPYGRDYGNGYFSNTTFAGSDLIFEPFGTNPLTDTVGFGPTCEHDCNLQSFQAVFQARLNDPTSVVDQGRAAALIDMMLGQQGPNFNGSSQSGIVYAQANFQKWENLLAVYALMVGLLSVRLMPMTGRMRRTAVTVSSVLEISYLVTIMAERLSKQR